MHKYKTKIKTIEKNRNFNNGISLSLIKKPRLLIESDLIAEMQYVVNSYNKELEFRAFLKYDKDKHALTAYGPLFIPKQKVTSATFETSPDNEIALMEEVMDAGHDPSLLRFHCHSHVNMGVSPSGTDTDFILKQQELMQNGWYVRTILNKRGELHVDICNFDTFTMWESCDYTTNMEVKRHKELKKIIEDRVQAETYNNRTVYPRGTNYYDYDRHNNYLRQQNYRGYSNNLTIASLFDGNFKATTDKLPTANNVIDFTNTITNTAKNLNTIKTLETAVEIYKKNIKEFIANWTDEEKDDIFDLILDIDASTVKEDVNTLISLHFSMNEISGDIIDLSPLFSTEQKAQIFIVVCQMPSIKNLDDALEYMPVWEYPVIPYTLSKPSIEKFIAQLKSFGD
jgi:hypothetical protein